MRRRVLLAVVLLWLVPALLPAGQPALPNADDPVLEARLNVLAADLRCVVCQNESLAESRASLALDLREEIREMMRDGMTDDEVVESLVARYGDFVLYRPPVKPMTYALWGGPLAFLLIGVGLAAATLHRRRTVTAAQGVSPEMLREAARLLESDTHPSGARAASRSVSGSPMQEER
ncbi:cytochrome c-type biogenesis protein [Thioalkalivibrio paradoxus]|uniref:Cytochrome c-type biogenesis protein n=1 Tax=Thioalkalivibrio paradoxus ARh 1 TaxID=713585 RepID=W0DRF4_9GAMM|nr:cytochrome c-type biogenesis protein [Thioalkalivibrio paradoxus]AHE99573.1 cytochrome C biogenesis protein CcmH [Thioalkalivibrio paradoxus ARh 1]